MVIFGTSLTPVPWNFYKSRRGGTEGNLAQHYPLHEASLSWPTLLLPSHLGRQALSLHQSTPTRWAILVMALIRISFDIFAPSSDHRRRMYTSNALAKIVEKLEENLHEVHNMIEADHDDADVKLKDTFEVLYQSCSNFSLLCSTPNTGLSMTGKTRLDKERLSQCQRELVRSSSFIILRKQRYKAINLGNYRRPGQEMEDSYKQSYRKRKVQRGPGFPGQDEVTGGGCKSTCQTNLISIDSYWEVTFLYDSLNTHFLIFLSGWSVGLGGWPITGSPPGNSSMHNLNMNKWSSNIFRTILYSMIDEECGQDCGNLQTVFLKVIVCLLAKPL